MTFEIEVDYENVLFKADVTKAERDFLVNLSSPLQYETVPTMVFTMHDDETMVFDNHLFNDDHFMNAIADSIKNYLHTNNTSGN